VCASLCPPLRLTTAAALRMPSPLPRLPPTRPIPDGVRRRRPSVLAPVLLGAHARVDRGGARLPAGVARPADVPSARTPRVRAVPGQVGGGRPVGGPPRRRRRAGGGVRRQGGVAQGGYQHPPVALAGRGRGRRLLRRVRRARPGAGGAAHVPDGVAAVGGPGDDGRAGARGGARGAGARHAVRVGHPVHLPRRPGVLQRQHHRAVRAGGEVGTDGEGCGTRLLEARGC
jgi:hypothetical protein